jgi:hypothetical protein
VVPENSGDGSTIYDVTIPTPLSVSLDVNPTVIDSLTVQANASLNLNTDPTLSLTAPTISNNGAIAGEGQLSGTLTNNGTLSANLSGQSFSIQGTATNFGLMTATNGGTLTLGAGVLTNLLGTNLGKGGVYEADANSTLNIGGPIATNSAVIVLGGANASIPALQSMTSNNGELTLQNGATFATGADLANAGVIVIDDASAMTVTGNFTQSTDLTIVGGSLTNSGNVGATINGGTLQIGDGGANGVVSGNIIDNSAVVLDRSDSTASFANAISGSGTLSNVGSGTVTLTGVNSYLGLTQSKGGTLVIGAASALPTGGTVINSANFAVNAGTSAKPVVSGAILGSGTLAVGATGTPGYLQLQASSGTTSQTGLTIDPASTLDITNNVVTINFTPGNDPAATIRGYLQSGYGADTWTGPGIVSSDAAVHPGLFAVGYADGNTDSGTPAAANQIYIAETLAGDANLDGVVNFPDLLVVAQDYGKTGEDWAHGDFNYDGIVNFPDLLIVAQNYGKQLSTSQLAELPGSFAAQWQLAEAEISFAGVSNVPEPTTLSILAIGAAGLLSRRRNRRLSVEKSAL